MLKAALPAPADRANAKRYAITIGHACALYEHFAIKCSLAGVIKTPIVVLMGMNDALDLGPTQLVILNPKALVEARKRKRWTQSQLSEATKPQINVSTISRIERGKPYRVRESTLKQFATALGVQPRDLCEDTTPKPDLMKVPMGIGARNALALVAKRYRVNRRTIIELAPLSVLHCRRAEPPQPTQVSRRNSRSI